MVYLATNHAFWRLPCSMIIVPRVRPLPHGEVGWPARLASTVMRDLKISCARLACDLVALGALLILFIGVYVAGRNGRIVRRGFYCDDESLKLPYLDSTVPSWALITSSLGIPLLGLVVGNLCERYGSRRWESHLGPLKVLRLRVPAWLLRLGFQMRWFFTGLLITLVITDIGKLVVGRLRPHFLNVCNPDYSSINCTDQHGYQVYVSVYECRGEPSRVVDARMSWPSGHASTAGYAFVFLALYVSSVPVFYHRSGLKLLLMLFSFLLAMLTALSRISDHKHHPTDVLSGLAIGTLVAIGIVYHPLSFFSHFKHQPLCGRDGYVQLRKDIDDPEKGSQPEPELDDKNSA